MSLLRHVRAPPDRFLQCGMGPDVKRRLSKSTLHSLTHLQQKAGGNGPIDLSVQDSLVALSN